VRRVLRDYEISQRRACVLIGVDPKTQATAPALAKRARRLTIAPSVPP
jgi:hypothetical protein